MATPKLFPQTDFLRYLELLVESAFGAAEVSLPPKLARILLTADGTGAATPAATHLIQLLKARKATLQAAFDTELAADELRRYHKFPKPGAPSPHIILLRQRQAGARQTSVLSKQAFIKAATAFVKAAGLHKPQRVALEVFANLWIDANVPSEFTPSPHAMQAAQSA